MTAERAVAGTGQTVTLGLRLEDFGNALALSDGDGKPECIAELCPEHGPHAFEAKSDLGSDSADEQRRSGEEAIETVRRGHGRHVVEGLGPQQCVIDRFDQRDIGDLLLVQCDDRRLELALERIDLPEAQHPPSVCTQHPLVRMIDTQAHAVERNSCHRGER